MTIKYLLTIFISSITLTLSAQIDTLYVWAESGLLLRDKPNVDGKVVGKLDYGDTVVVTRVPKNSQYSYVAIPGKKVEHLNSAEVKLEGHFVELAIGDSTAFAFDGYLSQLLPVKITTTKYGEKKRESWKQYFDRTKGVLNTVVTKKRSEKIERVIYTDGTILSELSAEGYGGISIVMPEMSTNEVYLLIQGINGIEYLIENAQEMNQVSKFSGSGMSFWMELCELHATRLSSHFVIINFNCSC